jgi:hypothetical protein
VLKVTIFRKTGGNKLFKKKKFHFGGFYASTKVNKTNVLSKKF